MYRGRLVNLRAHKKEDMEQAKTFLNDYEVRKNLCPTIPFPYTLEDEYNWYNTISATKDTYTFAIETLKGKYIGGCGVNSIDWKNSKVIIGIFIGDKEYWNSGYGTDALKILIKFIFKNMNINKISLRVYAFNSRAIRCYEKCGFIKEGVLRDEIFTNGMYYDEICMSILKKEYKSIT